MTDTTEEQRAKILQRSLKLAIECLKNQKRRHVADANLCEQYGMDTLYGRNSAKRRRDIDEAIKTIAVMME